MPNWVINSFSQSSTPRRRASRTLGQEWAIPDPSNTIAEWQSGETIHHEVQWFSYDTTSTHPNIAYNVRENIPWNGILEDTIRPMPSSSIPINDNPTRELTYGEKAVWLSFNPTGRADVTELKKAYAQIIDTLHLLRIQATGEASRHYSIAITETETAQMRAIKAITWVN